MHRSVARMRLSGAGAVLAVAAGGMLLAACGGAGTPSGSGGTTSSTSAGAPTGSTGSSTSSTPPATPSTSGGSTDAANAIAAALQNGQNATFDATYKVTGSANVQTFEVATEGAKEFAWIVTQSSGKSEFIGNGTKTWACADLGTSGARCIQYPSADASSLAAAYAVFTGKYWYDDVTAIKQYSGLAGFHESTSSMTVAGQSANCVTWSGGTAGTPGAGGEVCVTGQGVLAYAKATNTPNSISLESVSSSVSSSMFEPPPGVTVQTIPG